MNIPIYRADRTDGLGYIEGYLIRQDDSEKFSIVKNFNLSTIYGMVCPHDIDITTLAIHFPDMLDGQGNRIFASLSEDGKGGDVFNHSINCRLDSPRPHDGTYWINCNSPLVYKSFGFYLKYHIIDSTPKYADGKITNRKGLAKFEKDLEFIGVQQ